MTTGFSWSQAIWAPHSYAEVCLNFAEIWSVCKNSALSLTPRSQAQRCSVIRSAVLLTPRSQAQRCFWHHGVKLSGVIDTKDSSSAVLLTPRSQAQRCYWHHGVKCTCLIDTSSSAVSPWCQALQCHWHCGVRLRDVNAFTKSKMLYLIFHRFFPI